MQPHSTVRLAEPRIACGRRGIVTSMHALCTRMNMHVWPQGRMILPQRLL